MLLSRIYQTFPLACPICHARMRIISFINDVGTVRKILDHIGESTRPPRIAPAHGLPLREGAAASQQVPDDPRWDSSAQPAPQIGFDQRITWQVQAGAITGQAAPASRGMTRAAAPRVAAGGHSPSHRQCFAGDTRGFSAIREACWREINRNQRSTAPPSGSDTPRRPVGCPILRHPAYIEAIQGRGAYPGPAPGCISTWPQ